MNQLLREQMERKNITMFGGSLLKNSHAKIPRLLDVKRTLHLVLRSSLARGRRSFLHHEGEIYKLIAHQARKFKVKVHRQGNGGNHLHLAIQVPSRQAYNGFVRAITGLIARKILGSERGSPGRRGLKFWDKRPFTRIVDWGFDFRNICRYLDRNTLESHGVIPYQERKSRYKSTS